MKYLILCALILGQQTLYAQTTLSPEVRSYIDTQIAKQNSNKPYVIYMSPQGKLFNQNKAINLAKKEHLIIMNL